MKDGRDPHTHHVSARVHFGVGAVLMAIAAVAGYSIHSFSIVRDLQMLNLDLLFLSQATPEERARVVIVDVTEEDYHDPALFQAQSPLNINTVRDLITACALSGAHVIAVDLDTSGWKAEDRDALAKQLLPVNAGPKPSQIVWAVGAWPIPNTNQLDSEPLAGLPAGHCEALPASLPDRFGVVRGYLAALKVQRAGKELDLPGMAKVIDSLDQDPPGSCTPASAIAESVYPREAEDKQLLVNYSARRGDFLHFSAGTILGVANSEPWKRANPLMGRVVLIGGSYSEARDKYVTPAGYLDGVDILGRSVLSAKKEISVAQPPMFVLLDVLLGAALLTATWYLRRAWSLFLAFVLLPILAVGASFAIFHVLGLFASFVPVVVGVLIHRMLEHFYEHWQLQHEVRRLRARAL